MHISEAAKKELLAKAAKKDNPAGFMAFFYLIHGMVLPKFWQEIIKEIYDKKGDKGRFVLEMFRGASKTTVITISFTAFRIGHNPELGHMIIQIGDDAAKRNAQKIANIIEYYEGWRMVFPKITPDKQMGWGADGYYVLDEDVGYSEWQQKCSKRNMPTLMGVGYKSGSIIGKRPDYLNVDDIHDEGNTASEREMRMVKTVLNGTILKAANKAGWRLFVGTPWNESDALHYLLQTGLYTHIKRAVYTDGKLTWPEYADEDYIADQRAESGEIEYARMYLLDLSKTKGLILKKEWIQRWPAEQINLDWPVYIGIDYTSTADPRKEAGDHFALAVGHVIPGGRGVVIADGAYSRVSQAEAEDLVYAWAARYPTLQLVGLEAIITGNEFYNMLLNNAVLKGHNLPLLPIRVRKSKGYRYEKEMAPLFQRSRMYVSTAENTFLTAFQDEWANWQGDALERQYHNDALDAVYCLMKSAEGHIAPVARRDRRDTNPFWSEKKQTNPFVSLGRK